MLRPPVRTIALVVALWAVLFAPGALDGAGSDGATADADRLGAAIVAPTFDGDVLVGTRVCGLVVDDHGSVCGAPAGLVPASVLVVAVAAFGSALGRRAGSPWLLFPVGRYAPRGPPAV